MLLVAPSAALPYTVPLAPLLGPLLLFLVPPLSPVSGSWLFLRCLPVLSPVLLLSSSSDDCCHAAVVARVYGSPVLALPRLVPASPSLESPLARASRSPRPVPRFPVLGVGALAGPGARLAASRSRCPFPGVSACSCVAFSTSGPCDSLSLALASSPVPSSSSVSRPTSSLFLVVPLYVSLELLFSAHPGESLFSVRSLEWSRGTKDRRLPSATAKM